MRSKGTTASTRWLLLSMTALRAWQHASVAVDHDAVTLNEALRQAFPGVPVSGCTTAGEIGPVGGGYFLHTFTATVAVFA